MANRAPAMTGPTGRKGAIVAALLCTACVLSLLAIATPASATTIAAPRKGEVRALAIGVDLYRNVRPLAGALADAEDLALSLRSVGATDVTLMTNGDAGREAVMAAFEGLIERTTSGDLVVLSIAGHGTTEPERVAGTKPTGRDEVYILAGFDTRLPGSRERIFDDEFKAVIRRIEDKGADIVFIADTCHAGGMSRNADERTGEISWRQVPAYALVEDDLTPISTTTDAVASLSDFKTLTFLAAVDANTKSPEVRIPGVATKRGALSYAVARAFQGAADADGDRSVTRRELYQYVRQSVYQLSDQRQNIFTEDPQGVDIDTSPVFAFDGAVTPVVASAGGVEDAKPILVAMLGAKSADAMNGVSPASVPFKTVSPDRADLIYDAETKEAVSGGDVIAAGAALEDMPFIVDRMAALATFKTLSERAPQTVRIAPDDSRHVEGERVTATVSDLAGRQLVLFDVTGDGRVQFLYPSDSEAGQVQAGDFNLDLAVVPPFGTDMLVAVSLPAATPSPGPDLVAFLKRNDGQRKAARVADYLRNNLPGDARLGFAVLYTASGEKR